MLGVGSSRGRRSSKTLRINDVIDFWRVEDLRPNQRLLLRAEMKIPGRAWLQFNIDRLGDRNRLAVNAFFDTSTIFGRVYWHMFKPFHNIIFEDLIRQIERRN